MLVRLNDAALGSNIGAHRQLHGVQVRALRRRDLYALYAGDWSAFSAAATRSTRSTRSTRYGDLNEIARQTKRIALTIRQRRQVRQQALGRVRKRPVFVERLRERHRPGTRRRVDRQRQLKRLAWIQLIRYATVLIF